MTRCAVVGSVLPAPGVTTATAAPATADKATSTPSSFILFPTASSVKAKNEAGNVDAFTDADDEDTVSETRRKASMYSPVDINRQETHPGISSANLRRSSSRGRDIDAHTAVIRFNDAPTGGAFQNTIGKKTTLRVQNDVYLGWAERKGELCLGFSGFRTGNGAAGGGIRVAGGSRSIGGSGGSRYWGGRCEILPTGDGAVRLASMFWMRWAQTEVKSNTGKLSESRGEGEGVIGVDINQTRVRGTRRSRAPASGRSPETSSPHTLKAPGTTLAPRRVSAGFFGVLLALNLCAEVDLYGFGSPGEYAAETQSRISGASGKSEMSTTAAAAAVSGGHYYNKVRQRVAIQCAATSRTHPLTQRNHAFK